MFRFAAFNPDVQDVAAAIEAPGVATIASEALSRTLQREPVLGDVAPGHSSAASPSGARRW